MMVKEPAALSRRQIFGIAAAAMLLPAIEASAESARIKGNVVYRERIALPPSAVVEVSLVDVSRADASAITIARVRIRSRASSPVPYVLDYDPARIKPKARYALQARISDGDRLLFINTTHHPILTGGKDNTDIAVERVGAPTKAAPSRSPFGKWLAEDILGGGVIDRLQTVLQIGQDGAVTGTGGCNRIRGTAKVKGRQISFGPIASTRMACSPAVMDQERKFHQALGATRSFQVRPRELKLVLLDGKGVVIMRLTAM